jgi:hypothetical protein
MENRNDTYDGERSVMTSVTASDGSYSSEQGTEVVVPDAHIDVFTHQSYYGPRVMGVVNPFSFSKTKQEPIAGTLEGSSSWSTSPTYTESQRVTGVFANAFLFDPDFDSMEEDLAYNKALNRFAERLRGSDLEISIMIAEANRTKTMILDAVAKIARIKRHIAGSAWNRLRKIPKEKRGTQHSKDVANAYLQLTYGWTPLLMDLHNLLTKDFGRENVMKIEASGTVKASGGAYYPQGYGNFIGFEQRISTGKIRYKFGATVRIKDVYESLKNQLSSYDPALIAWELVPYSFVADWFIGIGSFLETRAALANTRSLDISELYQTKTTIKRTEYTFFPETYEGSGTSNGVSGILRGWRETKTLVRTRPSISQLTPRMPIFDFRASFKKLANATALLRQLL